MKVRRLGASGPEVSAIGFGAMLLSVSGRPDEEQARRTLHTALDSGINWIDTADAYCLDDDDFHHNEKLLARLLMGRRDNVLIATKCACRRPRGAWIVDGRPEYLKETVEQSLRALDVEAIDLLQLHAPDRRIPIAESVGALADLKNQGKVKLVGLSNVNVAEIEQARAIVPIASVQNWWSTDHRDPERSGVLDYCAKNQIAFIPYSPLGGSRGAPLLPNVHAITRLAAIRRVSAYQFVLAWMLKKSPVAIPIVGARRPETISDSARAADLEISDAERDAFEAALR
jgi:aryl-alcohol dehydrogenase-like predicted oxidoreductase